MVELALLQSVSYIAGAIGVCVAAIFYVLSLRISQRNQELTLRAQEQNLETRRLSFVDSITIRTLNRLGMQDVFDIMQYEWKDYEDFERKYGTENNAEAAAKRYTTFSSFNSMGAMIRKKIVTAEDLYDAGIFHPVFVWEKYRPVVEEGRRRYFGQGMFKDFEFLARELKRVAKERDPSYVFPETLDRYVPGK